MKINVLFEYIFLQSALVILGQNFVLIQKLSTKGLVNNFMVAHLRLQKVIVNSGRIIVSEWL